MSIYRQDYRLKRLRELITKTGRQEEDIVFLTKNDIRWDRTRYINKLEDLTPQQVTFWCRQLGGLLEHL